MNSQFEYDIPEKQWTYDNIFDFATQEFNFLMTNQASFERVMLTDHMKLYIPSEKSLTFGKLHQRLMYYAREDCNDHSDYTHAERQSISEFKIHCKASGHKIPDRDEEILRNLYARKMDHQAAYEAIMEKQKYQLNHFPLKCSLNVLKMLQEGIFYIAGRDRNYRPLVVVRAGAL